MPSAQHIVASDNVQQDGSTLPPLLRKIRNMWEFASLVQYIYLFGDVLKISKDVDVDTLEMECCKPTPSELLQQVGLALLKFVSSHRGLTLDLFDEYARRQYDSKAPNRENPFGEDEEPRKFNDFNIFLRIRVLQQLSVWTFSNPDRIRQALPDENEQSWRIEPLGWDSQDRTYYSLDDNRLYRMIDPPLPETPTKKKVQKPARPKAKGSRSSKRQKLSNDAEDSEFEDARDPVDSSAAVNESEEPNNSMGLGGGQWECVAVSLQEYRHFAESIRRSKDPNEKTLYNRLVQDMIPVIEEFAAAQERKAAQKRRELENLEKLATAKRSSRIADKQVKVKEQQEAEEAEKKKQEEFAMLRREKEKQKKLEQDRESRMLTREQRLKDREVKRILHEQELARLESQSQSGDNVEERISERRRKNELEKKKKEIEELMDEDEEWYFDCSKCGVHGKNLDDGTHVLACEKCNVWQHSACHDIKEEEADSDDFHFVCTRCERPPKTIVLNMNKESTPKGTNKKRKKEDKPIAKSRTAPVNGGSASVQKENRRKKSHDFKYTEFEELPPHPVAPYESIMEIDPVVVITSAYDTANWKTTSPNSIHNTPDARSLDSVQSHTTDALPAQSSDVSWNNSNSHSNQRQPTPHDPILNGFGKQRIASYITPRTTSRNSETSTRAASSINTKTPPVSLKHLSNRSQLPPIAASPAPSLSATQGNTNVRFSPLQYNDPRDAEEVVRRNPTMSSYVPETNRSNASAVSPVKQASSPAPPLPQSSPQIHDAAATPAFSSMPAVSKPGLSPVKHDTMPTASEVKRAHGLEPANPDTMEKDREHVSTPQVVPAVNANGERNLSDVNGSITSPLTSPVPKLSPTIGLNRAMEPNAKKESPPPLGSPSATINAESEPAATLPPAPALQPTVGLNRGVEPTDNFGSVKSSTEPFASAASAIPANFGLSGLTEPTEKRNPPAGYPASSQAHHAQPGDFPPVPTFSPSIGLNHKANLPEKNHIFGPPSEVNVAARKVDSSRTPTMHSNHINHAANWIGASSNAHASNGVGVGQDADLNQTVVQPQTADTSTLLSEPTQVPSSHIKSSPE